ncbi:hypothetical protein L3X38_032480 [Prunus dulcis]|uniref:Ubiquitin-like protease family profile domain-containing protein n=1 Tax=Prunus dulcis TaxID=3755 RepID=A0AAD4YWN4_PRUDU|nr:hypothetical protein L3X38_032480 [Prunus dulcis]
MKRRTAVVRETPWTGREIPNISEDTIADPLRPVPHDSLLENIDIALLLLQERHESSGNWKFAALDYKQMKAYVGKKGRQHNKGLLGMVKGKGPKLAKSWSSVNCVCLPFNLQRQKHWILLVVDLKECEIRAYDSKVDLCRTQAIEQAVQPVVKMLHRLLKESRYIGDGLLLKSEWLVIRIIDAPQPIGVLVIFHLKDCLMKWICCTRITASLICFRGDCGMYILKYCEFLTSNVYLAKISHEDMPFYRLKLIVQLLQGYW